MLDVMRSNAKSSLIALIFGAIILTFIFSFGTLYIYHLLRAGPAG